jgi:hypothetical protein
MVWCCHNIHVTHMPAAFSESSTGGSVAFTLIFAPSSEPYFRYPPQIKGLVTEIIRDPEAWANLWCRLTTCPGIPVREPAPEIDFGCELLVAVGGMMQTDGGTIEIDDINANGDTLIVRYRRGWDLEQSLTDGFSWPVVVARVPYHQAQHVTFVEGTPVKNRGPHR